MECLLDDLRAFGMNTDQWTTAAPTTRGNDARPRNKGRAVSWRNWSLQRKGLGWTTACSSMLERDGKDQGEDSPKQACPCWFARHR